MSTTEGNALAAVPSEDDKRRNWIAGMRELLDFFEANPDLDLPQNDRMLVYCMTRTDLAQFARAFAHIGGAVKSADEFGYFNVERKFGTMTLQAYTARENVCQRVVVGEETVEVPDLAKAPRTTETREIVEWRCSDPLLAPTDEVAA